MWRWRLKGLRLARSLLEDRVKIWRIPGAWRPLSSPKEAKTYAGYNMVVIFKLSNPLEI